MSESRDLVTAEAIQRSVLNRIAIGLYESGTRLPSVRELASELGSNRNTVNKAYQNLISLGVIEAGRSKRQGFTVKGLADLGTHSEAPFRQHFRQQLSKLVWEGMAAGLAAEEIVQLSSETVQEVYKDGGMRLAFYECNELDSQEMGRHLNRLLGRDITCGVLKELEQHAENLTSDVDVVITTFHHIAEVVRLIPQGKDKVVGIDTRLTPETLLDIAHLPDGQIGLVCGVQATAHMLEHVLHGYYPHLSLEAITLEEPSDVHALAQKSDHIVATHTCAQQVETLIGRPADVVVNFQVDEQSLSFLKGKIQKIQASKMAEAPAVHSAWREERAHRGM
jgi:DNA-binding transcriptional regulator YhcF (GntR family)